MSERVVVCEVKAPATPDLPVHPYLYGNWPAVRMNAGLSQNTVFDLERLSQM